MKKELKQKEIYSLEDCFCLKKKNVVIFGGAGKMAKSFSKALLSAGCKSLILVDINKERLEHVVKNLAKEFAGRDVHSYTCNVSDEAQVDEASQFLKEKISGIDVLIYAVMSKPRDYYAPFSEYSRATWDEVLDGNLSGAFLVTQKLIPLMNEEASIIFISSTYGIVAPDFRIYKNLSSNPYGGKYPLSLPAVYSASKAGLIGLGKYLAVYLADRNIRVNILVPGGVYDYHDEAFYQEYIKRVPLKRMATWSDYNGAVIFLASDASRYMTGQLLVVDGGWSVW